LTALLLAGYFMYHESGLLLDPSIPGLGVVVVSTAVLAVTLAQANIERRRLALRLQEERESAARLAGELDAARRIQMGFLPRPEDALAGEWRVAAHAVMLPARKVGGDLYDFFKADEDRLFFIIGDVSGKGLNASIFMAVVKALAKSAALRGTDSVAEVLRTANAEVSRENPEAMFVTAFAGLLELTTGRLVYCNAGHEPPLLLREGAEPLRLVGSGGPPLCVLEDYPYESAEQLLAPGHTLCLVTDGVTEAMNAKGELYGTGRLAALLAGLPAFDPSLVVNEIETSIAEFARGTEPADDITVLALQWRGGGD
jgi:serine phosphatase RsbU (regulator of sigma subunit)